MVLSDRFPKSGEDHLLQAWWDEAGRWGLLWLEVEIGRGGPGRFPDHRSHRRLDGLYLPDHPADEIRHWQDGHEDFAETLEARPAHVLEAKAVLNLDVIGQLIAGVDLLARAYPDHGLISQVAVVGGPPDPALDWLCAKRGIVVKRYPPTSEAA